MGYKSEYYATVDVYKTSNKNYIINTQNAGNKFRNIEMDGAFANYYTFIEKEKEKTIIIKCSSIINTCIRIDLHQEERYLIDYDSYKEHD